MDQVGMSQTVAIGARLLIAVAAMAAVTSFPDRVVAAQEQSYFATPEAAVEATLNALEVNDEDALLDIFGHEHTDLIVTTDKVAAREDRRQVYEAAQETWTLQKEGDTGLVLIIGPQAWPMPIPLIKEEAGWRFDTAVGAEEILNRRIGENELEAIAVARAYVAAQAEYASQDRDGDDVLEFAQRIASSAGRKDGLYWEADPAAGAEPSPFGPLVADARRYLEGRQPGDPYKGYYYKILMRQGKSPPGGRYDYVINGNMIAGHAMLAFPADYGSSGIMTFVVSHQGRVFEKDIGDNTRETAEKIEAYDPDDGWAEARQE